MKKLIYILSVLVITSCSFTEINDDMFNSIDLENTTPTNIESELPTINITVDQAEFDNMYNNFNEDISIVGDFEMWRKPKGEKRVKVASDLEVKLEIKGVSSARYSLKSFGLKFSKTVDNTVNNVFSPSSSKLDRHSLDEIRSLRLRNSGNDFERTMIKDISYTELAINASLNFEFMYFEPVQVFINNKYYGLLNLRTEKNQSGISKLFGVKKKDVYQIKIDVANPDWGIEYKGENTDRLEAFVNAVKNDNLEFIEANLDIDSYIDYVVFEDYIGNDDWPHNNTMLYYIKDGLFRFELYDLDMAGNRDKYFEKNNGTEGKFMLKLHSLLIQNPEIKSKLIERQKNFLNSILTYDKFREIVDKNATKIEFDIRYNAKKHNNPDNIVVWYNNLQALLDKYSIRMNAYKNYYNL